MIWRNYRDYGDYRQCPRTRPTRPPIICKNVVIFDWDDTLLPSYDLQRLGLRPKTKGCLPSTGVLSQEQKERVCSGLKRLEQTVHQLLFTALQHVGCGHVVVVTNAERGWVELSCSRFMPNVMKVLRNCKVVSARSTFEQLYPSSTIEWKRRAIKMVLDEVLDTDIDISRVSIHKTSPRHDEEEKETSSHSIEDRESVESKEYSESTEPMNSTVSSMDTDVHRDQRTYPVVDVLQVLSFGDSLVERQAVFDVTKCITLKENRVKMVKTKSVKLTAGPSIHWLLDELNTIQRSFVQILQHPHDLDFQVFVQQKESVQPSDTAK